MQKHALVNGANGVVTGTACVAGLATSSSLPLIMFGGIQIAIAAIAPRSQTFRRLINRKVMREQEQRLARRRASLLAQMDPEHGAMIESMETMFEGMRWKPNGDIWSQAGKVLTLPPRMDAASH